MADPLMSTKAIEILARDLGLTNFDYGVHTVQTGQGAGATSLMKPGMLVTTFGQTGRDVDVLADNDQYATGIAVQRKNRKISADGSVEDDVDSFFTEGDEIIVLYLTPGRGHVYMWLTGLDATTNDEGTGLARRGAPVYVPNSSSTAASATNRTVGAGMVFGASVAIDYITGATLPLIQIGTLLEDVTILDSASAAVGVIGKVAI